MKIPRVATIGGRKIKTKFVDMKDAGLADFERGEIHIKKKMKRSAQEATWIHEAFHHMNTTIPHALIDSLAEQTYALFRNNKMFR